MGLSAPRNGEGRSALVFAERIEGEPTAQARRGRWRDVEAAIRRLDGRRYSELTLALVAAQQPVATAPSSMVIGGGLSGRVAVTQIELLSSGERMFHYAST